MEKTKIAFLGTGLMGLPMALLLCDAGYELNVFNRTKSKTEPLAEKGSSVFDNPTVAIEGSEIIIVMLSDYSAVCSTLFKNNFRAYSKKTVIQMSTISPDENILLKNRIEDYGGSFIEAPVLGSIPQIKAGSLFVLVGADHFLFNKWQSFLKNFGEEVIHFGEVGKASSAKLALNQLIVTLTSAFSMSLGYVRNKDVDVQQFMNVLRKSALYAPAFDKKLENMISRDYRNPNFPVKHLLKDVKLMNDQFGKNGIDNSILQSVIKILADTINDGYSEYDYSALYNTIHPED